MMMCIAALVALCTPAIAAENNNIPPVKQEFRIVKESDLAKNDLAVTPMNKTEAEVNGQESSNASESAHSGYIVISGAGLLLLIILLIILL